MGALVLIDDGAPRPRVYRIEQGHQHRLLDEIDETGLDELLGFLAIDPARETETLARLHVLHARVEIADHELADRPRGADKAEKDDILPFRGLDLGEDVGEIVFAHRNIGDLDLGLGIEGEDDLPAESHEIARGPHEIGLEIPVRVELAVLLEEGRNVLVARREGQNLGEAGDGLADFLVLEIGRREPVLELGRRLDLDIGVLEPDLEVLDGLVGLVRIEMDRAREKRRLGPELGIGAQMAEDFQGLIEVAEFVIALRHREDRFLVVRVDVDRAAQGLEGFLVGMELEIGVAEIAETEGMLGIGLARLLEEGHSALVLLPLKLEIAQVEIDLEAVLLDCPRDRQPLVGLVQPRKPETSYAIAKIGREFVEIGIAARDLREDLVGLHHPFPVLLGPDDLAQGLERLPVLGIRREATVRLLQDLTPVLGLELPPMAPGLGLPAHRRRPDDDEDKGEDDDDDNNGHDSRHG